MILTIWIGVMGAIAAGLACWASHAYAEYHGWGYVPRYVLGVFIAVVAYTFVIFSVEMPIETGAILLGLLLLIFGGEGIATWLAHQNDPPRPRSLTPEADQLLREIDEELSR